MFCLIFSRPYYQLCAKKNKFPQHLVPFLQFYVWNPYDTNMRSCFSFTFVSILAKFDLIIISERFANASQCRAYSTYVFFFIVTHTAPHLCSSLLLLSLYFTPSVACFGLYTCLESTATSSSLRNFSHSFALLMHCSL